MTTFVGPCYKRTMAAREAPRSIRFSGDTWDRMEARAKSLGVPTGRLVDLVVRKFLGDPVDEYYMSTGRALAAATTSNR